MAKSSVKKTNIKQTITKIAKKIMTKAIAKDPKAKTKKAEPAKKTAVKPAAKPTKVAAPKAVEIKKSTVEKNKKPAILQKITKEDIKTKGKGLAAKTKLEVPAQKAKSPKASAPAKPTAVKVDTSTKAIFKKENLIFKEPHELLDNNSKNNSSSAANADEESKKDKKNKGIVFKVVSGQEAEKWKELQHKLKNQKPQPYSMKDVYEAQTPIQHKTLGWGVILNVQNDRLEVLFEEGIKFLISNYRP